MNMTEGCSFALPNVGPNPHRNREGEKLLCEIHNLYIHIYKSPRRCNNAQYIFFISLQNYSTCFLCLLHPLSAVQETVVIDHWYRSYVMVHNLISPNTVQHTHNSDTVNSHTTDCTINNTNISCSGYRGCCSSLKTECRHSCSVGFVQLAKSSQYKS
jgi:hypothetical protein